MHIPELWKYPQRYLFLGPLVIPLIAAGVQITQSIRNAIEARRAQKKANEENRRLADMEFAKNKQMWELQNQYNDPNAQMMRFKGAGLNPNLIYGSGNPGGNQSGSSPSYNAPSIQPEYAPLAIPEVLGMYQDFNFKNAQTDNVKANTEAVRVRNMSELIHAKVLDMQAKTGLFDLNRRQQLAPFQQTITEGEAGRQSTLSLIEIQRLRNMSEEQKLKLLDQQYRKVGIQGQQIEVEKKREELWFLRNRNKLQQMGINQNDPLMVRLLYRMFTSLGLEDVGTENSESQNDAVWQKYKDSINTPEDNDAIWERHSRGVFH